MTVSKDFKLSYIILLCLLETDNETIRFTINKWGSPSMHNLNVLTTFQELCLQRNPHKSISNTNSPQCDRRFIKQGRSHIRTSKKVHESNDISIDANLKECLDWDSFATLFRRRRSSTQASGLFCIDSSDPAVSGSKSRL